MGLILDTNFVIAAEQEARRGTPGRTDAFLAQHVLNSGRTCIIASVFRGPGWIGRWKTRVAPGFGACPLVR